VWAALCGLVVGPGWRLANSVVTVLPRITAVGGPAERHTGGIAKRHLALEDRRVVPVGMS